MLDQLLVLGLLGANVSAAASANNASCNFDSQTTVTVTGTIRLLRATITPLKHPDGTQDYSIIDSLDEYELSSTDWLCSAVCV